MEGDLLHELDIQIKDEQNVSWMIAIAGIIFLFLIRLMYKFIYNML